MREFPNATKRPWALRASRDASGDVGITASDLPNVLAETFADLRHVGERARIEAAANAVLIVHAVNTYEERERLLDEAASIVKDFADSECDYMRINHLGDGEQQHNVKRARAFLAKLEDRRG